MNSQSPSQLQLGLLHDVSVVSNNDVTAQVVQLQKSLRSPQAARPRVDLGAGFVALLNLDALHVSQVIFDYDELGTVGKPFRLDHAYRPGFVVEDAYVCVFCADHLVSLNKSKNIDNPNFQLNSSKLKEKNFKKNIS